MTAIADLSDLINLSTGGGAAAPQFLAWHKTGRASGAAATAPIAGRPASLWTHDGAPGGTGAAPGAWANPTNTTAGALGQTDPGGGRQLWLTNFASFGLVAGVVVLYDRLGHNGGLNGTTTTAQTFTGTITRYTDGIGNVAWIEIYTIIGTTGTTVTMTYTDQSGTGSNVSPAQVIGGTGFREVTRIIDLPLTADTGIQSIQDVDLLATTGTAGSFGVTLAHPLAFCSVSAAGGGGWRDFATGLPGIPEIKTDACLALRWLPQTTTAPELFGMIGMVEK